MISYVIAETRSQCKCRALSFAQKYCSRSVRRPRTNQLSGSDLTIFFAVNLASSTSTSTPPPSLPLNTSRHSSFQHLQHLKRLQKTTSHHPSCLARTAVPPLRLSAPPSRLLSLALRPSSPLRLARPAPSPSLLRTSTLLLPPLPSRPRPQRAVVAVSSARWPALLRKLPRIEISHIETLELTCFLP